MNNNVNGNLQYPVEEYDAFIGPAKSSYYVQKFMNIHSGAKASWNWPAFLVAPIWLLYRKMYAIGIGVFVGNIVLQKIHWLLPTIVSICIGIFGNYLYYEHVHNKMGQINNMGLDPQFKKIKLSEEGGVNIVIPIVFGVIYGVLILIAILAVFAIASFL